MSKVSTVSRRNTPVLLLIFTLAALVFSYHPLVTLGSLSGVHIDLSVLYFLMISCAVFSLPLIWKQRSKVVNQPLLLLLLGLLASFTVSLLWTSNPLRGMITSGFFMLIVTFVIAIALRYKELLLHKKIIFKVVGTAYVIALTWAVWQVLADLLGISPAFTLLPSMYDGDVFGVARPTGFALEPQFLASLLLIPLGFETHKILSGKKERFSHFKLLLISTVFFLTLSRGAYIGLSVLLLVLLTAYRTSWQRYLRSLLPVALGLFIMLLIVLVGASARPDNISGYSALRRTVSHISLGVLNLPEESTPAKTFSTKKIQKNPKTSTGYVKSSTSSRVFMSQEAIKLWVQSPHTVLFGVGVGGFGTSLAIPEPDAIVNNYYLELLTETGIIGFGLFFTFFAALIAKLAQRKAWLFLALIIGLLSQALFFSGNANILHIWAIIGIAIGFIVNTNPRKAATSSATID